MKARTLVLAALVGLAMYAPAHATGTFFRPAKATVLPPVQTKQSGQASGTDASAGESYPETLSGTPQVVDTATLAIDGHRALLKGLEGLTGAYADQFTSFIADVGGNFVTCSLIGLGPYYRCVTQTQHIDVADAALLNGAARANADATPSQRLKETQARDSHRGVWANSDN